MESIVVLTEQETRLVSGGDLESEAALREFLERMRRYREDYIPPGDGLF
jgi:hypothetical protein